MSKISLTLAVSLIIVSGIIGVGIGYTLTPEYKVSMYDKTEMDLGTADKRLDLRYINAMAAHHRGAMLVAEQAQKNGQRQEIKDLAAAILEGEPKLIAELYQWKKDWYQDNRTVTDPIVPNLGPSDEKFDLRFINAAIAHHEAGIKMTQEVRLKSSRAEVLNNADAVEAFLKGSVETLKAWRAQWYNI
jgi:uncharacterized protein (DUF305 family)